MLSFFLRSNLAAAMHRDRDAHQGRLVEASVSLAFTFVKGRISAGRYMRAVNVRPSEIPYHQRGPHVRRNTERLKMGEPVSVENVAAGPAELKWWKLRLRVGLPLLVLLCLAGYARLRVEATDWDMQKAVTSGSLTKVRWLLRIRPSLARALEVRDARGFPLDSRIRPVLFCAVDADNPELIALLISKGAGLKTPDEHGRSPLEAAIAASRRKSVEALLQCGAPVDPGALVQAAYICRSACLESLLNRDANVNCRDQTGDTPLLAATWNNSAEAVRLLLVRRADPNAKDKSGRTPLFYASNNGDAEKVKLLLSHGANPNAKGNTDGTTPLHAWALWHNEPEVGQLLLASGADPNAKDNLGRTPLRLAAINGRAEVVKLLLAHGADPNADPSTLSCVKRMSPPAPGIVEMLTAHSAK